MRFAAPQWLSLLLVLPFLVLLVRASDRTARRRLAELFGRRGPEHIEGFNPRLRPWRRFLTYCGLIWLIVALARPQWGASEVTVTQKGTDIIIALDISNSMLAEDVPPSRLERAKGELGRFLDRQDRGRIGLVLFAGAAFVQCPLTLDYGTASLFLRMAEPDMISQQGTAIASALAVSRELLTAAEGRGEAFQAILLVTDGEDLEGDWQEEARSCAADGISVIPVGIGEETGGLIPVHDAQGRPDGFLRDVDGNVVMTRLDLHALETLAGIGGGSSFRVGVDGMAGERLRGVIKQLGERDLQERRITAWQERFAWPLALALACIWMRLLIRRRRPSPAAAGSVGPFPVLLIAAALLTTSALPATVPVAAAAVWRPAGAQHAERGSDLYRAGDYEAALPEFEAARALDPDDPRLSLAVGETLHRLERYQEAVTEFRRALRQTEDEQLRAESLYNEGTSLLASGDGAQASEALRRSLGLDPDQQDALFNLEVAQRLLEQPPPDSQEQQSDQQDQQEQQEQQEQQDQQGQQDQQDQPQDQQRQQDQQQQQNQQQQDQQETQQDQQEQEASESSQADELPPESPESQPQTEPDTEAAEQLSREQALQLLRALDHDEQQLKRSVQQRLQETRNKSGKRW